MKILDIYKDSLSYPNKDIDKLLTLGVLFFLDGIISLLPSVTIALNQNLASQILYFISNIFGIIVFFIVIGYGVSIIKNTITDSNMPSIKIIKNFINGIKIFIISIIYYILPSAITLILAYFSGVLNGAIQVALIYLNYGPEVISHISHLTSLDFNMDIAIIIAIIGFILFVLTTLFLFIAIARFAYTNKIKSSFYFKEIINDINNITWKKYLISDILFLIILIVLMIIATISIVIPFIGFIIFFLAILPFVTIFSGRTFGLIYKEGKELDKLNNTIK